MLLIPESESSHFLHIWKYIKDFDYLIRIDEDIMIKKFDVNIINNIDQDFVFGTAKFSNETHKYTNQSLPDELMKKWAQKDPISNYENLFITKEFNYIINLSTSFDIYLYQSISIYIDLYICIYN